MEIYFNGTTMFEAEFRAQFPNTSLPSPLTEELINELGGDVVFEGPQATGGDHYQYSQRQGVEQIDGKWYTKYVLGPIFTDNEEATAAEQEANYKAMKDAEKSEGVRKQRNTLLSDWVDRMNPVVWEVMTEGQKQSWRDYRQALLDVPNQAGFPWDVQWPENPTELAKKN